MELRLHAQEHAQKSFETLFHGKPKLQPVNYTRSCWQLLDLIRMFGRIDVTGMSFRTVRLLRAWYENLIRDKRQIHGRNIITKAIQSANIYVVTVFRLDHYVPMDKFTEMKANLTCRIDYRSYVMTTGKP